MIDKLKIFRDTFSEKTKMLIYVAAAIIVLIISCLVPLSFGGTGQHNSFLENGKRADLYVRYINNDKSLRYKVEENPEKGEVKFCQAIFDEISGYCIVDNVARKTVTEGCEFINITDSENSIRLCHMWLQDQGDWTNWLDVYMDADTGFVYYFYVNSMCIGNSDYYLSAFDEELSARTLASSIAKETGYDLKILNWSGKSEDTAVAYTVHRGDALIWNINCSYYPGFTLDIKVSVS